MKQMCIGRLNLCASIVCVLRTLVYNRHDQKLSHLDNLSSFHSPLHCFCLFSQFHLPLELTPQDSMSHLHWVRGLFLWHYSQIFGIRVMNLHSGPQLQQDQQAVLQFFWGPTYHPKHTELLWKPLRSSVPINLWGMSLCCKQHILTCGPHCPGHAVLLVWKDVDQFPT